jgi:uncharacterized protein (TIGR00369 family)
VDVAFAKLSAALRRNELVLLASVLAGLVMALVEMAATWVAGAGLWAFPGYVAATVLRSMQAGGTLTFSMNEIALGMGLHLVVAVVVGGLFAALAPRLREATGLDGIAETPAYGVLGLGFGLATFAVAWWGLLPYANPVMVQGLDPTFLGAAHGIWGLSLGVTRKAWNQTAPNVTRRASTTAQPTPAGSRHKAPASGSTSGPSAAEEATAEVETLQPQRPVEPAREDPQPSDPDEDPEPADEEANDGTSAASSGEDELSPWPDPPDASPDESEEEAEDSREDGYATPDTGRSSTDASEEADDGDEGLAMTEHARRSLRGLTDREPDLPPVHEALNTTLTHVAPGRAVCTLDASERLHDATGAVQSGLLISLAELAAAVAMETEAPEAEHSTVASEVQIEGFVEEGHVVAEAEVTEQAGTTTLAEVEVRDASGQVLVAASFQAVTADD